MGSGSQTDTPFFAALTLRRGGDRAVATSIWELFSGFGVRGMAASSVRAVPTLRALAIL